MSLRHIGAFASFLNAAAFCSPLFALLLVFYQADPLQPLFILPVFTPVFALAAFAAVIAGRAWSVQWKMVVPMGLILVGTLFVAQMGHILSDTSDAPFAGEGFMMLLPILWGVVIVMLICAILISQVGKHVGLWPSHLTIAGIVGLASSVLFPLYSPFFLVALAAFAAWWVYLGYFLLKRPAVVALATGAE